MRREISDGEAHRFSLPAYADLKLPETATYPFREFLWLPLCVRGCRFNGGFLLARERPWSELDTPVLARQAGVVAHAFDALAGQSRASATPGWQRWGIRVACVAALLVLFVPVPMSVVAPVEVVARQPSIKTAPLDGVIERVHVEPNQRVSLGDVLFSFNDTEARNRVGLAKEALAVAEAAYRQAVQAAFGNEKARHDLAIRKSEMELKQAELDYARDVLARSQVRARRDGTVVFGSVDSLEGRPLRVGERVMEVADASDVAFRIDLPIADAIVLSDGAPVRVFLDKSPLRSFSGVVSSASYEAKPDASGTLAYRLVADVTDQKPSDQADDLRIGARGSAQIFGKTVSLGFFLFRRPISWLRQNVGI